MRTWCVTASVAEWVRFKGFALVGRFLPTRLKYSICSCCCSQYHVTPSTMQSKMRHHCTCHLCINNFPLQFQVVLLHERRHELLTFPNRPLSHESCLVCRLVGRQRVHNIVLSKCLADSQVQTMPGFSHFAKLSPCKMCMASRQQLRKMCMNTAPHHEHLQKHQRHAC